MSRLEQLKARRGEILQTAEKHGAFNVRVFGSVARETDDDSSDIDFLVSLRPGTSLFDLAGLYLDFEEMLGARVDVVSDGGLSRHLQDSILAEAVAL